MYETWNSTRQTWNSVHVYGTQHTKLASQPMKLGTRRMNMELRVRQTWTSMHVICNSLKEICFKACMSPSIDGIRNTSYKHSLTYQKFARYVSLSFMNEFEESRGISRTVQLEKRFEFLMIITTIHLENISHETYLHTFYANLISICFFYNSLMFSDRFFNLNFDSKRY